MRSRSLYRSEVSCRSLRPRASQPRISDVGSPPPSDASLDVAVDFGETPEPASTGARSPDEASTASTGSTGSLDASAELNTRAAEPPVSVSPATVVPVTVEPASVELAALREATRATPAEEPSRDVPAADPDEATPAPARAHAADEAEPMPVTTRERHTLPEQALVEQTPLPEPVRVAESSVEMAETQLGMEAPPVELASAARAEGDENERRSSDRLAAGTAVDRDDERTDDDGAHEDRHDELSLSSQFFRGEEDSVPPLIPEDDLDEPVRAMTLSPEALVRRARFRRVVVAVVGGVAALALVGVIGRAALTRTASASVPPPARTEAAAVVVEAPKVEAAPGRAETAKEDARSQARAEEAGKADDAARAEEAAKADAAKAEETAKTEEAAKADEAAKAEAVKAEEATKAAEAAKAAPSGDAKELRKEALNLLNRGKMKDAIPAARAAIAADPSEAMAYLYLGSALQDTGKWKEGIEAYSECVRIATKGPVHECRAMGGRK